MKFDQFKSTLKGRQLKLFNIFRGENEHELDRICDMIQKLEKKKVARGAVIIAIQTLSAKMGLHGFTIVRTTPIGRGHRASYKMVKSSSKRMDESNQVGPS